MTEQFAQEVAEPAQPPTRLTNRSSEPPSAFDSSSFEACYRLTYDRFKPIFNLVHRKQITKKVANKVRDFDENLNEFVAGKIPCNLRSVYGFFEDEKCIDWLKRTSEKLEDLLRQLHLHHGILPSAVLHIIAQEWWYIYQDKNRSQEELDRIAPLEKILSDNRGREKKRSVKILEAAIREVEKWEPLAPWWGLYNIDWTKPAITMRFHESINYELLIETLNQLRENIARLGKRKGRPQERQARRCARNLAALFQQFAGGPHYEYIAEIFAITWPQAWKRPASDNKDTIRQLINRGPAPLPGPNSQLSDAVALQALDPEYAEYCQQWEEREQAARKDAKERQRAMGKRRRFD